MSNRTFVPWSDDDGEFRALPDSQANGSGPSLSKAINPPVRPAVEEPAPKHRNWAFYLFSAALHLIAAFALSRSWLHQKPSANETAPTNTTPVVTIEPVAKIEIDVAPIKYCELDIHAITGQHPVISRLAPVPPHSTDKKKTAPRPRRRFPTGSGALSQSATPSSETQETVAATSVLFKSSLLRGPQP